MTHDKRKEIELIGSVAQLFMKLGIKSLTMDEIARQLGVSKKHSINTLLTRRNW